MPNRCEWSAARKLGLGDIDRTGRPAARHRSVPLPPGVLHLGGNLAEWQLDVFAPYDTTCWNPLGQTVLNSWSCQIGPDPAMHSVRGGS